MQPFDDDDNPSGNLSPDQWALEDNLPFVAEARFAEAPVGGWESNEGVFEDVLSDKPLHVRRPYKGKRDLECGRIRAQQHQTLMSVAVMVDQVMRELEGARAGR